MSAAALGLALSAAAVHALWNLLLARARDPQAATAVALAVAVVVWAPAAALTGGVTDAAIPYIAASAALHLVYFSLLGAAYRIGELSVTYPLARGSAPVLLVLAAAAGAGGAVEPGQVVGVVLVAAGIVAVRGVGGRGGAREAVLAGGVAACIAGYTLVDRAGLRHADPIAYLWLLLAAPAIVNGLLMARLRGRSALRLELRPAALPAGIAIFGAYALALAALRLAPAAAVGAVRECSVVIVAVLAATILHEPVDRRRGGGAVLVAGGIALIALTG